MVQVTKGVRVHIAETLADLKAFTTRKILNEVQTTPDKGSDVAKVDAPAIYLLRQRQVSGVQGAPDSIEYTMNSDFSEEGSVNQALSLVGRTMWVAEELLQAEDPKAISTKCIIQKLKFESTNIMGQSLNTLQTFTLSATNVGDADYLVTYTIGTDSTVTDAKYINILTGKEVDEADIELP